MPTRIFIYLFNIGRCIGDHPCFLTFYLYDCKITNFSLYLYYNRTFSVCNKILTKHIHTFTAWEPYDVSVQLCAIAVRYSW